jgi:hypothetical protein
MKQHAAYGSFRGMVVAICVPVKLEIAVGNVTAVAGIVFNFQLAEAVIRRAQVVVRLAQPELQSQCLYRSPVNARWMSAAIESHIAVSHPFC